MTRRVLISLSILLLAAFGLLFWWRTQRSQTSAAAPHLSLSAPVEVLKLQPDVNASLKNLGRNDDAYFHSWPILETHAIDPATARRFEAILNDPDSYGSTAEKCFEPEWAIRSAGGNAVLVSLKCGRLHLISSNTAQLAALNAKGIEELGTLLRALPAPPAQK